MAELLLSAMKRPFRFVTGAYTFTFKKADGSICGHQTASEKDFLQHQSTHDDSLKRYVCKEKKKGGTPCTYRTGHHETFLNHKATHFPDLHKYQCPKCRHCMNSSHFKKHMIKVERYSLKKSKELLQQLKDERKANKKNAQK